MVTVKAMRTSGAVGEGSGKGETGEAETGAGIKPELNTVAKLGRGLAGGMNERHACCRFNQTQQQGSHVRELLHNSVVGVFWE